MTVIERPGDRQQKGTPAAADSDGNKEKDLRRPLRVSLVPLGSRCSFAEVKRLRHREQGGNFPPIKWPLISPSRFLPVSQGSLCVKATIDVNISLDCRISGPPAGCRPLQVILKHKQVCRSKFVVWLNVGRHNTTTDTHKYREAF